MALIDHPIIYAFLGALGAFLATWTIAFVVRIFTAPATLYYGRTDHVDDLKEEIAQLKAAIKRDRPNFSIKVRKEIAAFMTVSERDSAVFLNLEITNSGTDSVAIDWAITVTADGTAITSLPLPDRTLSSGQKLKQIEWVDPKTKEDIYRQYDLLSLPLLATPIVNGGQRHGILTFMLVNVNHIDPNDLAIRITCKDAYGAVHGIDMPHGSFVLQEPKDWSEIIKNYEAMGRQDLADAIKARLSARKEK